MKNKILFVILTALGATALLEPETFMVIALALVVSLIVSFTDNSFIYQTGTNKFTILKRQMLSYVPFIASSTIFYLVGNVGSVDYVFGLVDLGIVLNIILRGILYCSCLVFFFVALLPMRKYYAIVITKSFPLLVKFMISIVTLFCMLLAIMVFIENKYVLCDSCNMSVIEGVVFSLSFITGSALLFLLQKKIDSITNYR